MKCGSLRAGGVWRLLGLLLVLALSVGIARELAGSELSMRGYFLEGFRADRGLPQNTISALLQTRDGYLWVVTPFGLARFDGVSFKTFTAGNTPGLREDMFTSLAEDSDGVLWAGTRDGLLRYEHGTFERLDQSHGLSANRIDALCPSRRGGVWAGTSEGVAYVQGRRATVVATNASIRSVFEDSSGCLWFSVDRQYALFRLDTARGQVEPIIGAGKPFAERVSCLLEEPAGVVWFGTKRGLHRWQAGKVQFIARYGQDLPLRMKGDCSVTCIRKDSQLGGLWVAFSGEEGLHLLKDGQWLKAAHPNWPALRHVRNLLEDAEGNLWLGTEADGLIRMRRPRLQTYGVEHGLLNECIWSVCPSHDGGAWAGGIEGFSKIHGETVSSFRPPGHWSETTVRSIYEDRGGGLWLGDHRSGVYRFANGKYKRLPVNGLMKALYEDRSGTIWAGTSQGMARIEDGEVKQEYTTRDGLSHRGVRAFLEDRNGTLWIGTYGGGITLLSNKTLRALSSFPGSKAWSFYEDSAGVIWIGTDRGLYRHEDGRFFVFTTRHGLFDDLVNHLVEDDSGRFWISCNRGIYRVSRAELNDVAAGRLASVNHVAYGEADGMVSSETNGEYQPAGCKTPDGRIWFPTQRGVVVIDPKTVYRNELPPPVIIERVVANDRVVFGQDAEVKAAPTGISPTPPEPIAPIVLLPGGAQVLEVRYTANSFVDSTKTRFKHQLVGHDSDWRDAGARRVAYYTNLRPGKYRFRVIASNNHGYWNERGAEFAFTVKPHFHETWPFYGLCALGFVSCAAGVQAYRLGVQRRFLRLEQESILQRERERIAQDMHDDLGANLTRIAILTEVARQKAETAGQARARADTICNMARSAVDNISEIVWVTNPRNDHLENLAGYLRGYAAEFFENTSIRCIISFPEQLASLAVNGELRRDILLVFKEALHNVAKHSGASETVLTMKMTQTENDIWRLLITVSDNGRGFDAAQAAGSGNGLHNMRQRIEKRGGIMTIISKPTQGTRVTLSLDLAAEASAARPTTFV